MKSIFHKFPRAQPLSRRLFLLGESRWQFSYITCRSKNAGRLSSNPWETGPPLRSRIHSGKGHESSALALSPRGRVPLDSRLFWGWGRALAPVPCLAGTPCLADTPRRDDRPPTHFFVKKKFGSIGGAESTTQGGSRVFCYAHTLCGAGSIPHAGGSFFLYEKSVLRESDSLRGREREVCTDLPPLFFRP